MPPCRCSPASSHAFGVRGVTVTTRSEAPAGAGIAGSSALNIAVTCGARTAGPIAGCPTTRLLEIAKNVEAQVIRVPTGLQDYRPALYGGIAALELGVEGAVRVPLDVPADDLDERLVVCYTGAPRDSGINNWDITKRRIDGDARGRSACFDAIVRATADLRAGARARRLAGGRRRPRRRMAGPHAAGPGGDDAVHRRAARRRACGDGAWAGKVCGAGGGGCVFCLAPPERDRRHPAPLAAAGADGARRRRSTLDGVRVEGLGPTARPDTGHPTATPPVDPLAEIRRLYFAATKAIDRPRPGPRHRPAQAAARTKTSGSAPPSSWTACRRCDPSGARSDAGPRPAAGRRRRQRD